MTTRAEQSIAEDALSVHRGLVVQRAGGTQSAAVRGANHAFNARGNNQKERAHHGSSDGARAAAASAGYASRQKSASPPKNASLASTTLLRSQSAQICQVQQLVKGFEQTSTGDKLQLPNAGRGDSRSGTSRSPSQVAARIASSNSFSPPSVPLPLNSYGKPRRMKPESEVPLSNHELPTPESGSQSRSTEGTQSADHEATATRRQPLRRVSSAQAIPSTFHFEQNRTNDNKMSSEGPQSRLLQVTSSKLAAQAAVRNFAPLTLSSVSEPPRSFPRGVSNSEEAPWENLSRGRSSTARTWAAENKVIPRNGSHHFSHDEPSQTAQAPYSGHEPLGRSVSKFEAPVPTPSAQSLRRNPSMSNTHYVDEKTGLTEVSLADAIVASSLASSRAPSPAKKVPAPPPPRRSSLSRALFRHRHSSDTDLPRHGGPYQGMRQTLRKYESDGSDDEKDRRNHKHFMKHPNKHREGSRQRWKDKVAERERKRYEGVWAANKGLFVTNSNSSSSEEVVLETSASEMVLNLVVRDIWSRSRLPVDILAEIWDLVDREGVGTLSRDEFVLGLWLIDQRLKGRKLPTRVSPTLWASVRHTWGVRIPRRL
jgi:hypothetical protein